MRRVIAMLLLAGCGDDGGGSTPIDAGGFDEILLPELDAAVSLDARPLPSSWTVTIVEPPEGDAVLMPLGMDRITGDVVGYAGPGAWEPVSHPVRVVGGVAQVLDVPEANYGFSWGASSELSAGEHAWQPMVWEDGVRTPLPVPDGWFSGSAHAADETGLIVGSWADYDDALPPNPIGPRPCTWRDGAVTPLPTLGAANPLGAAWAVDATGGIAGAISSSTGFVAARWASPTSPPVPIAIPSATLAEARAINVHGDVAGRASFAGNVTMAFVAVGADVQLLPFLPGATYAEAFDLDGEGHVVGTAAVGDGTAHAVLWADGAIVDLNDHVTLPAEVRHLSSAVGIDDQGRIAAEAVMTSGSGDSVRWLAILTPVYD